MSGRPGGTDPLDALIGGDSDELADEDRRLAELVDHLFVTYMPPDEPRRTLLLRRFTDFGTAVLETSSPRRRRMAAAVALAGTFTGKLVLGGAVAVAAAGGLHVTDTVQVPVFPAVGAHDDSDVTEVPPMTVREPSTEAPARSTPSPAVTPGIPDGIGETDLPPRPSGLVPTTTPAVDVPTPTVTTPEPTVTVPDVTVPDVEVPSEPERPGLSSRPQPADDGAGTHP